MNNSVSNTVITEFSKRNESYRSWMDLPLLVSVCCTVRECVAGYVTCEPARTANVCQWPSVLLSINYAGKGLACRELPNNSFLFLTCMFSIIPMFPLQCLIRVCCLVCVIHTLRSSYWFLWIVYVPYVLLLLISWSPYVWIVSCVTFKSVYPAGISADLNYFVSE